MGLTNDEGATDRMVARVVVFAATLVAAMPGRAAASPPSDVAQESVDTDPEDPTTTETSSAQAGDDKPPESTEPSAPAASPSNEREADEVSAAESAIDPESPEEAGPTDPDPVSTEPDPAAETTDPDALGSVDEFGLEQLLAEPVVAGASRSAESSAEAPATVEVITATQLRVFGVRTLDEAFNYLSLGMHADATGATAETGARSVTLTADFGNHILLLIDGHVANSPGSGTTWFDRLAGIPIESIDRIEIIYGPGSVLYGTNAMLAVVNVVMREGHDVEGARFTFEGAWSPDQNRYGNFGSLHKDRVGHRERIGGRYGHGFDLGQYKADILLHAEYVNDQLPAFELGPQYDPNARGLFDFGETGSGDPTVWGGYAGAQAYGPYGYARLRIEGFTVSARGSWISLSQPNAAVDFGEGGARSGTTSSYVDTRYDYIVSKRVSGLARLYMDHLVFRQRLAFPGQLFCGSATAPCSLSIDSEEVRGGLENQWTVDWFANANYQTMVGFDARVLSARTNARLDDNIGSTAEFPQTFDPTVDGAIGVYAQQLMRVHKRVAFNAGGRYDYFAGSHAVSPRGAAIFSPWRGGTLKLLYSQAYRAPSLLERSDDPNLDPEIVRSVELSLGQSLGTHRITVAAFGSRWDDLVQRAFVTDPDNPGPTQIEHRNADNNLLSAGGNVGYSGASGALTYGLNAGYAWTRIRLDEVESDGSGLTDEELVNRGFSRLAADRFGRNQPLTAAPEFTGNLRLAYAFGELRPTLGWASYIHGPRLVTDVYSDPTLVALLEDGADDSVPLRFSTRLVVSHEVARYRWGNVSYQLTAEAVSNTAAPHAIGPFNAYTLDDNATRVMETSSVPRMTAFGSVSIGFGRGPAGQGGRVGG